MTGWVLFWIVFLLMDSLVTAVRVSLLRERLEKTEKLLYDTIKAFKVAYLSNIEQQRFKRL